ncbi:CHAD domain-containing protein [Conexibacter woesei]|uniref:CHAD domain-containing protein n=1 Tax=Conexibacter woesei TaxID=191495 RepID=UPI000402F082|nr:CHAD domain-containing protein [Conexibacter woesei]
MSRYRLDWDRPLDDDIRAVAAARLEHAADGLGDASADRGAAIHGARKDIKKTRALLRLARPGLKDKAYRRENDALRDTGRSLSAARDAQVLLETLDGLRERAAGQVPEAAFDGVRAVVAERGAAAAQDAAPDVAGAVERLGAAAARAERWPLRIGDGDVASAIATAYARGRAAMRQAERSGEAEDFHQWRKRVKDLWYHQRLLKDTFPELLPAQAKATKELSELLGDDHDLAVLRELLCSDPALALPALLDVIDERRAALQADAFRLGHRLYAERPKAFRRRFTRYLGTARSAPLAPAS